MEDLPDLVERARRGQSAAFAELARRYRAGILALAFSRTGNREEAEDLVQETLVAAWQKIGTLREPASFGPWLRAIARNACQSWFRRSRPWPQSLEQVPALQEVAGPDPAPLEVVLDKERQRAWQRALLELTEANRVALLMHVWDGSSYQEIADFLGVPLTTVEGRIYRAKQQLRRLLRSRAADLLDEPAVHWREEKG